MKDVALSLELAGEPRNCFINALLAAYDQPGDARAKYVEGFAFSPAVTLLTIHGWFTINGGTVVDPTVPWAGRDDIRYFPVDVYPAKTAFRRALKLQEELDQDPNGPEGPLPFGDETSPRWMKRFAKAFEEVHGKPFPLDFVDDIL
jgi:hypothetical protein